MFFNRELARYPEYPNIEKTLGKATRDSALAFGVGNEYWTKPTTSCRNIILLWQILLEMLTFEILWGLVELWNFLELIQIGNSSAWKTYIIWLTNMNHLIEEHEPVHESDGWRTWITWPTKIIIYSRSMQHLAATHEDCYVISRWCFKLSKCAPVVR